MSKGVYLEDREFCHGTLIFSPGAVRQSLSAGVPNETSTAQTAPPRSTINPATAFDWFTAVVYAGELWSGSN